ncbi:MAG TPA: hypothetical protein VK741_10850, partial [Acetobacteraceae bacterium]|nr:hypothetical protein [Acetobacteraceae bacterium]
HRIGAPLMRRALMAVFPAIGVQRAQVLARQSALSPAAPIANPKRHRGTCKSDEGHRPASD